MQKNTKKCSKCHTEKPKSAFSRMAAAPDKLQAWCKLCVSTKYRNAAKAADRLQAVTAVLQAAIASDDPTTVREAVDKALCLLSSGEVTA